MRLRPCVAKAIAHSAVMADANFQSLEKTAAQTSNHWKCRNRIFEFGKRPLIMGVLNVTPDSFSDGNKFFDPQRAVDRAFEITAEGADIIDIGGESSRPGAEAVGVGEEVRRVVPVIEKIAGKIAAAISVDTTKSEVAEAALAAGAHIVNDITALAGDEKMIAAVKKFRAGVVLMHMQGTPRTMQQDPKYADVVRDVGDFLRARMDALAAAGIERDAMAADPGIGFGKAVEHNVALLVGIPRLRAAAGRPLVIGISRKSFLGKLLDIPKAEDRAAASLGGLAYAAMRGAEIFRVHDVKDSCEIARLLAILRATQDYMHD